MQEQTLQEVLHTAATGAAMPERFSHPSRVVLAVRPVTRWRRPALAAVAAVMALMLTVLAFPGGRALAGQLVRDVVTMWSGKVGGAEAQFVWSNPAERSEMPPMDPGRVYHTFEEASAAAGIRLVETHYAGAELVAVLVQTQDLADLPRFVSAVAHYRVGTSIVSVATDANLIKRDGKWQLLPYVMLVSGDANPTPPENFRTVKLGSTEAVAYDQPYGGLTYISWLQDGVIVHVSSDDPNLAEAVAAATVK